MRTVTAEVLVASSVALREHVYSGTMKEPWGIPEAVQIVVRARDKKCVYCGVTLTERSATTDRKTNGTWEHIDNDS